MTFHVVRKMSAGMACAMFVAVPVEAVFAHNVEVGRIDGQTIRGGFVGATNAAVMIESDVTIPFDNFALDSATAITMSGDLEDWLGRSVDPMLVYDYPTIADLAEHLARDNPSADSA